MESRIPRWVWVFTIIIVAGFVLFLTFLSQVPEDGQATGQDVKDNLQTLVTETIEGQVNTLTNGSDKGEETGSGIKLPQLDFYRLLTEQEVATLQGDDAPVQDRNSADAQAQNRLAWVLQAGSFKNAADADSLRAELILRGLTSTHIEKVDLEDKGIFYRVMVGPIPDRSKMNQAKDVLVEVDISPIERRVSLTPDT